MKKHHKKWSFAAATLVLAAGAAVVGSHSGADTSLLPASAADTRPVPASADGLGQLTGDLPRENLTLSSAINVDLDKETVRLPLYEGRSGGQTVWFVLLDASDQGLAANAGINYAPKLANLAIGCPECVQEVTLDSPSPAENPFGQAIVNFPGAPDFSPKRIAEPGPNGFPLANFQPGAVAQNGYTPFIRIKGSPVVYSAPIVATGHGPFDVKTHTNTHDRALDIHIAPPSPPGQYLESWVDMLFVKGFDAGEPIVYLSTDAGQPLSSVLERSTYVPALDRAAYNGGDDFLGSSRERLFAFVNGQTGADNKQGAGLRPPGQGRPRLRRRKRRQHTADQRPAQRRRPAQRLRRLPDPGRSPPRLRLQPALGRPDRPVDRQGHQAGLQQAADRRERHLQPGRYPPRSDHRPRRRPLRRHRHRHQLRRDRLHRQAPDHQPRGPRPQLAIPTPLADRNS